MVDAATGEPRYRINAALACAGQIWNADGSLLLFGSYELGGRTVVANPENQTFAATEFYLLTPNPADPNLAILFDGQSFLEIDLRTPQQGTRTIAETTVSPAWFFDHEPFFAGDRIVFEAPHLGHGGCGEGGSGVSGEPAPRFEFPPFAD